MDFQTKLLLISFSLTVILALFIIPILKRLKVGQIERDDGPRSHLNKQGTPTMGGIIIIIAISLVTIFAYYYYSKRGEIEIAKNILPILCLTVGFGLIGLIDDFKKLIQHNTKGLRPTLKMLGLLFISVAYVIYLLKGINLGTDTYIPFLKLYITIPTYAYIPFAILVILGTTNAVNLTDGIDALASSVTVIIITCLTIIATVLGIKELVIFCSIVIGSVLGFLLFNIKPAKVFMGDTGSLFLGGVISGVALYLKMPLLLLVLAIIPVIETISVIIQVVYFKVTGNRFFKMAPIHHHLELSGWRENKIVIAFSIITLIVCTLGLQII